MKLNQFWILQMKQEIAVEKGFSMLVKAEAIV